MPGNIETDTSQSILKIFYSRKHKLAIFLNSPMCVCPCDRSMNLQTKKINRVESTPLEGYGLENLTTVTKINLHAFYVCMLIMCDPWPILIMNTK